MSKSNKKRESKGRRGSNRPRLRVTLRDQAEANIMAIVANELGMTVAQLLRHSTVKLINETMDQYNQLIEANQDKLQELENERPEDSAVGTDSESITE
jgi:hypothetical protein